MKSFYRRMAEEKGIINNQFTVEVEGMTHFMSVENIIDLIEQAPRHEKRNIKDMFSKLDFMNKDLLHYIKFLASAFIKTNYKY